MCRDGEENGRPTKKLGRIFFGPDLSLRPELSSRLVLGYPPVCPDKGELREGEGGGGRGLRDGNEISSLLFF